MKKNQAISTIDDFKDIKGYRGIYRVNRKGVVMKVRGKAILSHTFDKRRMRPFVSLNKNLVGKGEGFERKFVDELVLSSFVPIPENFNVEKKFKRIKYKDGNPNNVDASNLDWNV